MHRSNIQDRNIVICQKVFTHMDIFSVVTVEVRLDIYLLFGRAE